MRPNAATFSPDPKMASVFDPSLSQKRATPVKVLMNADGPAFCQVPHQGMIFFKLGLLWFSDTYVASGATSEATTSSLVMLLSSFSTIWTGVDMVAEDSVGFVRETLSLEIPSVLSHLLCVCITCSAAVEEMLILDCSFLYSIEGNRRLLYRRQLICLGKTCSIQ